MKKIQVLVLAALVMGVFASCATFATNQGVPQKTIPILSFVSGSLVPTGEVIASYTKLFGICLGYDEFVQAVEGQDYDVTETFYLFTSKVRAISKDAPSADAE
jgi:hypothetical protein